ncbi:MAG: hypothetical protein MUF68_02110 [Cyclobacteriaceae bacterium]|jgi:hypothetical protein|nr:hypothetical protein [Cyclobacteriaceae bacterium]
MSNKKFWIKKVIGFTVCGATIVVLFGYIVMLLWNNILADVTPIKPINFWQSLGLLLLSKILFGGFNKGFAQKGKIWSSEMKAKWHNMSETEKEQFKQQWRSKCNTFKQKSVTPTVTNE